MKRISKIFLITLVLILTFSIGSVAANNDTVSDIVVNQDVSYETSSVSVENTADAQSVATSEVSNSVNFNIDSNDDALDVTTGEENFVKNEKLSSTENVLDDNETSGVSVENTADAQSVATSEVSNSVNFNIDSNDDSLDVTTGDVNFVKNAKLASAGNLLGATNNGILKSSPEGYTFDDIQAIIDNADSDDVVIDLEPGVTYTNPNQITITMEGKNVKINGNGAILDAYSWPYVRAIYSDKGILKISDLTIINAGASISDAVENKIGSAIWFRSEVQDTCVFQLKNVNIFNSSVIGFKDQFGFGGALSASCIGKDSYYEIDNLNISGSVSYLYGEYLGSEDTFFDKNNYVGGTGARINGYGIISNSYFSNNREYMFEYNGNIMNRGAGAGLQVSHGGVVTSENAKYSTILIENSRFENNGNQNEAFLSHGGAICTLTDATIKRCVFINNSAAQGGAITAHANLNVINSTFINNLAYQLYGGAISTDIENINEVNILIDRCNFENNYAVEGGAVYLKGDNVTVNDCIFNGNLATTGGAAFIVGYNTKISNSRFFNNNASYSTPKTHKYYRIGDPIFEDDDEFFVSNGGAIYTRGEYITLVDNIYDNNHAISSLNSNNPNARFMNSVTLPLSSGGTVTFNNGIGDGLGGAIFIEYAHDVSDSGSSYTNNKARNGSAIYIVSAKLNLEDAYIQRNQAYSYELGIIALPDYSYYSQENTIRFKLYLIGGDNIANAIYSNVDPGNVKFNNVQFHTSYRNSDYSFTGYPSEHLDLDSTSSFYQYDHEDDQKVTVTIKNGSSITDTFNVVTNHWDTVAQTLVGYPVATYTVTAVHDEDQYYTEIFNTTTFTIADYTQLNITKESNKHLYVLGENVYYNITVTNSKSNAYNVVVSDTIPDGLVFVSADTHGKGTYNPTSGNWDVGIVYENETVVLTLVFRTTKTGEIKNIVDVNTTSYEPNKDDNHAENTILVNLTINKTVDVTNPVVGDYVEYSLIINNYANEIYQMSDDSLSDGRGLRLEDILPDGLFFSDKPEDIFTVGCDLISYGRGTDNNTLVFYIDKINPNTSAIIKLKIRVDKAGLLTNKLVVFGNEVPVTINASQLIGGKTVNKKNPIVGEHIYYNLTLTNPSSQIFTGSALMEDILPIGLKFVKFLGITGGDITDQYNTTQIQRWSVTNIKPGDTAIIQIEVKVEAEGKFTNTLVAPDGLHNVTVSTKPLISDKTVNNATPNQGDIIKFYLTVENYGDSDYTEIVRLTDYLPQNFTYIGIDSYTGCEIEYFADNSLTDNKLVWGIKNIRADTKAIITILVNVTKDGNYTNILEGPDGLHSVDVEVIPISDVYVLKQVNNSHPHKGDIIEWTITVGNNGPHHALSVYLVDIIPEGLEYLNSSADRGAYDNETNKWVLGTVEPFDVLNLTIKTKVIKTNITCNNTATVFKYYNERDTNLTNNQDSDIAYVEPEADLTIEKSVSNAEPHLGDKITYTIKVTNKGPDIANDVIVAENLPSGLDYFVSAVTDGIYNDTNGIWNIGSLDNGKEVTLAITFNVTAVSGKISNVAVVNSSTFDPNYENNKDTEVINVTPVSPFVSADLSVSKIVDNIFILPGNDVVWNITVRNNGPNTAMGVYVYDLIPNGLKFVSAKSNKGTYDSETGFWNIGDLINQESTTLTIVTQVTANNGKITNHAYVSSNTPDSNINNNFDNDTISIVSPDGADLGVVKVVSNKNPRNGDVITWTIIVSNKGPGTAFNTVVTDKLPSGLIYLGSSATKGNYDVKNGIWNVGDLANGEFATLLITTKVNLAKGSITNFAVGNSDSFDPNLHDNMGNVTINVDYKRNNTSDIPAPHNNTSDIPAPHDNTSDNNFNINNRDSGEGLVKVGLKATGNPIIVALLSLILLAGIRLKRKF